MRLAAVEVCVALLRIDKDLAVNWFCTACKGDVRIAACHGAVQLFNYAIKSHYEHLSPIILGMCESDRDEVAEEGAEEVTARWLFHGMFAKELDECKKGGPPLRKGVAQVAARFLNDERYSDRCKGLLLTLFGDPESTVRDQAARAFATEKVLSQPGMPDFVAKFIKSPAFADDPTWLLRPYRLPALPPSFFGSHLCNWRTARRGRERPITPANARHCPRCLVRFSSALEAL